MKASIRILAVVLLGLFASLATAEPVKLTPEQQDAAGKLKAKGASVVQIANDSDALSVNLALAGKDAGDAELALVKALPKVTQLNAGGTAVTDAGLANVAGLTALTHLHLDRTGVGDAGMEHLKGLSGLVYLNLYSTGVGDKGLESLAGLKNLRRLYLWQSKVTDAGAKTLKAANADLYINRGEEMAMLAAVKPPPPAGATVKIVNSVCPVSGKPAEAAFVVEYEGKQVGFCCDKCPEQFKKEPKKFASKIVATAAPAAPAPAAPAPTAKPEGQEGYIKTWLILAPIPLADGELGSDAIDKQQLEKEADLKPKEGDKAKAGDKELAWKKVDIKEIHFDINEILGEPTNNAVAYAVAYVEAPAAMKDVQLAMGSNDQGKAFLNGKEVVKFTDTRSLEPDADIVPKLELNKGVNVVILKVINAENNFQGCLRFLDAKGKPITTLKVKATP